MAEDFLRFLSTFQGRKIQKKELIDERGSSGLKTACFLTRVKQAKRIESEELMNIGVEGLSK